MRKEMISSKKIRDWINVHDINFGTFDEARAAYEDANNDPIKDALIKAQREYIEWVKEMLVYGGVHQADRALGDKFLDKITSAEKEIYEGSK